MKLTLDQITEAARGVAYIYEEKGIVYLHRFTREQEAFYQKIKDEHYDRTYSTAGVVLEFDTDSTQLSLSVRARKGSSRHWFVCSIFADGERLGELNGSFTPPEYAKAEGTWTLKNGIKRIKIVFPWSAGACIENLTLDDEASFLPIRPDKKVLIYGDSITQGYDASLPEYAYASILAEALGGNCINKAIGGEVFRPDLALLPDAGEIDLITVAYGTNDWSSKKPEVLEKSAREFYSNLRKMYPNTKIVVLAPVWRVNWQDKKPGGDFLSVAPVLQRIAEEIGNTVFLDCLDYIPRDKANYSPDGVHPNDAGFAYYAQALKVAFEQNGLL